MLFKQAVEDMVVVEVENGATCLMSQTGSPTSVCIWSEDSDFKKTTKWLRIKRYQFAEEWCKCKIKQEKM
jgi:hypothetical protein